MCNKRTGDDSLRKKKRGNIIKKERRIQFLDLGLRFRGKVEFEDFKFVVYLKLIRQEVINRLGDSTSGNK